MERIYEDDFVYIIIDEAQSLIRYHYKAYDAAFYQMTNEDYQRAMTKYAEVAEQYRPTKLLVNTRHSQYVMVPEMQEWTAREIAPRTMSLQKLAFVMSADFFAQVGLEQMMEEKEIANNYTAPRYFESEAEAAEWLGVAI